MAMKPPLLLLVCVIFGTSQALKHNRFARQVGSGWGEWGIWSACSRSCGGGVSYQERQCLPGDGSCIGPFRSYRSCQIQDCPEEALDFRLEQCAAFNDVLYEGRFFTWVPYEGGPNQCELNCMPKGEHFYYRHAEKVIDGTRCGPDTLNVCVDGNCRSVGCDMMLDSNAVEDMCRECGGINDTCRLFEGSFTRKKLPEGYNDIHIIPAGATNARIAELRGSNNYLALRNAVGEYYLNGGFSIDLPHSFQSAGTTIHYQRKIGSPGEKPEVITFLGPTEEPLFIVLLTQGRNHGIEYSYYVPNGVGPDEPDSYSWTYTPYSNCSKECGGGHQNRTVSCTRSGDYEAVPLYLCDPALKPRSNRTCNEDACPPRWYIGDWSPCSQTCDEGSQVRQVYCQQVLENGRVEPVEEAYCLGVIGIKPEYQQDCTVQICPHWVAGEWSQCSVECGLGTQTRRPQCMTDLPEPDSSCSDDERPEEEQDCNLGPCDGVDWITTEWTQCTGHCGLGIQSRQLYCATRGGTVFEKELCEMSLMPDMTQTCLLDAECGPRWVATHWSECSATCGGGVHSRLVYCSDVGDDTMTQVPDYECDPTTKFETEEICNAELCSEDYVWFTGPWGKCAVPCGGGSRSRVLVCMKGEVPQLPSLCDGTIRPITSMQCNMGACTPEILQIRTENCGESEFGCCPDNVTPATGPYKEGCRDCDATPFKCCLDGITPAKGENYAGCDVDELVIEPGESIGCEFTEFGCCQNEEDAATGENFEGCETDVAAPQADRCTLESNPGICRAWIVKYYFDTTYGQCTLFWYGGCGGNANLFDTYEECRDECMGDEDQLPQEDLCTLPSKVGPCKGSFESFFYSPESGRCELFKYGGCRGNKNRFRTESDCEIACGTYSADPCSLRPNYGGCRDSQVMWFFNGNNGMCEEFEYSGCLGNQNRFTEKHLCEQRCNANVIDQVPQVSKYDQCTISADPGPCRSAVNMWAYDVIEGKCKEFIYGGCDGNYNRFETELSCQEACYVEGKTLCERMQALFEASGVEDQPQCKFDGSFEPVQCPPRTGDCWCVTDLGEEIEGSRITRGLHTLRPDCSVYENSAGNVKTDAQTTTEDMTELSPCEQHQRTAQGSYIPQCTAGGEYEPMQCYGSNRDYCWCVNENGEELDYTRTLSGQDRPHCEGILETLCFRRLRDVIAGNQVSVQYMPQCTPQGLFAKLQCHTERGCLCVNETSGAVLFAVDVNPETVTPRTCDGVSTRVLTTCQIHRQEAEAALRGAPDQARYIPQCSEDGSYTQVQCYEGSARYCWCVNEDGEEVTGTRRRDGQPDCNAAESSALTVAPIERRVGVTERIETVTERTETVTERAAVVTTSAANVRLETTTTITTTEASVIAVNDVFIVEEGEEIEGDEEEEDDCTDSSNCQGTSSASISQTPSGITAHSGSIVVLTCQATGTPPPTITWQRDGQDVISLDDQRFEVSEDGTLTILHAIVSDSGPFLCVADNNVGESDTAVFDITVTEPRTRPGRRRGGHRQSRIKVREGKSVTMNCRAGGNPTPNITWEFQGLELSDIENRITKEPGGFLKITDVGLSDIGTYKCTARNMYGIIQMRVFTLIVEAEVKIVDPPLDQKVTEDETITLHCGTTGSPKPNVMWNRHDIPVPNTPRFVIGRNNDLTIRNIKQTDAGQYSCTAANGISTRTRYALVTVSGSEEDPNCQDQKQYVSCDLIVFAKLCFKPPYNKFCCRTCRDNGMMSTTPAPNAPAL